MSIDRVADLVAHLATDASARRDFVRQPEIVAAEHGLDPSAVDALRSADAFFSTGAPSAAYDFTRPSAASAATMIETPFVVDKSGDGLVVTADTGTLLPGPDNDPAGDMLSSTTTGVPTVPRVPATPRVPASPTAPATPTAPSTPAVPRTPAVPTVPVHPAVPGSPVQPVAPSPGPGPGTPVAEVPGIALPTGCGSCCEVAVVGAVSMVSSTAMTALTALAAIARRPG